MKQYDYLVVGSGLFGSVFSYEMNKVGKKCLVIESRDHIGGNCFTDQKDGINIHVYGPHIFHTNDKKIWEWVNQFTEFHQYKHAPKVNYDGKIYSFPINLLTLNQIWGVKNPEEAELMLKQVCIPCEDPTNLEDWILSQVGSELYEIFIKGYTKKQWQKEPKLLPSSIIKRIPIRTSFDDNYFFDKYQGIPVGGYTKIFQKLLEGIEVRLKTNYFDSREHFDSLANKIVFTGKVDEFFGYKFGNLDYRSLNFEHQRIEKPDFQGCSIMNFTSEKVEYTRITEHKHFENSDSKVTWITKEYPTNYRNSNLPFYPLNDSYNNSILSQYKKLAIQYPNVIFGGRLAEYRYYDMHQIIAAALVKSRREVELGFV